MKNTECTIYFRTTIVVQVIRKTKDGWVMTSSTGNRYPMTAEQVLSHLLPVLAGKSGVIVKVVPLTNKGLAVKTSTAVGLR